MSLGVYTCSRLILAAWLNQELAADPQVVLAPTNVRPQRRTVTKTGRIEEEPCE
jgi:hypothetical protein